jgi:4-carboxymuconolactone decarboxylase
LLVKIAYRFGRKQLTGLTGRSPRDALEPIEVFAHLPKLLAAYGHLEQATSKLDQLDEKLKMLAELKAATLTNCEYCIDIGSQIARRTGLTDEQLLALPNYRTSSLFSEVERLVLDYAIGMSRTPVDVPDELFARLREHFTDPQLVELTYVVALENLRGRFNLALGIGSAGFTEGMVCAVPEIVPERPAG